MIILMCDGSSKGNPGPMTIGYVIWDRNKDSRRLEPVYRHSEPKGYGTNNESEWLAVIGGLGKILTKKFKNTDIYVYSDSQLVIKQINGEYKINHENIIPLAAAFNAIRDEFNRNNVKTYFYWIPRQLTVMADIEANRTHETVVREINPIVPAGRLNELSDGG